MLAGELFPTYSFLFLSQTYTDWSANEPNNAKGIEGCLSVHTNTWNKWNDADCGLALPYICHYTPLDEIGFGK